MADRKSNAKNKRPERELFPLGKHELTISWVESGTSSQKGTPFCAFKLSNDAQSITHRCYMTDAAEWQIETVAKAAGVDPDAAIDAANRMDDAVLLQIFKGRKVLATIVADSYEKEGITKEGREVERIEAANVISTGEHLVVMSSFGFSESREKGTPALDVCFTAIDDPNSPTLWSSRWITEGSRWQVEDLAIAIGADPGKILAAAKAKNKSEIVKALRGHKLKIVVKAEEVTTSAGKTVKVNQVIGIDSMDAGIRAYLQKRRDARMEGGTLTAAPPKPKTSLRDADIPF